MSHGSKTKIVNHDTEPTVEFRDLH